MKATGLATARMVLLAGLFSATGCATTGVHCCDAVNGLAPNECTMMALPDYVIGPPDVLTVSAVGLVPKQPYRLRPLDSVSLEIENIGNDVPLSGEFPIGIDGTISLGGPLDQMDGKFQPIVGGGKTVAELQEAIAARVRREIAEPVVSVSLVGLAPTQDIAGDHLVAPDGTVTLGSYGRVLVAGLTVDEAKAAIEKHLSSVFLDPVVAVDVTGYNSKVYYVILQGAGLGDEVVRLPVTGNDTVLSAISDIEGLSSSSSLKMWVARPGCFGQPNERLCVNWLGITQQGDATTNYQLMPGDRLYVAEDKLVRVDTVLAKVISPIERVLGVTLLGVQTVQRIVFFDQTGNSGFGTGF